MQNVIDQITDRLVGLVKSEKPEYNPKELLKAGIPSFVVERIRLFLEDKVREEIGNQDYQWFDQHARLVSEAFQDYLNNAISSSFIPKSELYKVISNVVTDIINVFIEPRKKMAEYIFRDDEELKLDEIELRCERLTIYKHFGTAIPLYMQKRSLESLTKERCKLLIQKLDAKLVSSYTANDWAQKLEQLFILFGGKVHPMLLVTFFEDKGLYGMAGRFENFSDPMTKIDFIQILSEEDFVSLSASGNQRELSTDGKAESNPLAKNFSKRLDTNAEDKEKSTLADLYSDGTLSEEEMSELLSDIASDGVIEVDDYEHVDSLNKLFSLSLEDEENQVSETSEEIAEKIKTQSRDEDEEIVEFRENLISILDQAKNSFENIAKLNEESTETEIEVESELADVFVDPPVVEEEEAKDDSIFEEESNPESEVNQQEEKPIWAQFISEDHMDVVMGGERSNKRENENTEDPVDEEEEIEVEDSYFEESVIDEGSIFDTQKNINQEPPLEELLTDRKAEFVKVIFLGSETKYQKALKKLEQFGSWKETSSYIQKEIFAKNDVDMFSGATVDFTDRLHRYFNELSNN